MDEWLRLGFSVAAQPAALRKRKTELSNFDAYTAAAAPPPAAISRSHHAEAVVAAMPTVRGRPEKCQHQLNVTFARENCWIIS